MKLHRLALLGMLQGGSRSLLSISIIFISLSILTLHAGQNSKILAALEFQAVFGEHLGHLQIGPASDSPHQKFNADDARKILSVVTTLCAGARVVPEITYGASAYAGSSAPKHDLATSVKTEYINRLWQYVKTSSSGGISDNSSIDRFAIFLEDGHRLEQLRFLLRTSLADIGIHTKVSTWKEQSTDFAREKKSIDLQFNKMARLIFLFIAATIFIDISISIFVRRLEISTLRFLGMRNSSVFLIFIGESLWISCIAILLYIACSGPITWCINRWITAGSAIESGSRLLIPTEFNGEATLLIATVAIAVCLTASLVPAFLAAR